MIAQSYGDLEQSKSLGFYKENYVQDVPNHFSDPPYCVIKPGYRAHRPMPNFDQLKIKGRYSFDPFGHPKVKRNHQDIFKSAFRQTMAEDTPYFKDKMEPYDVKHALVDPTHTFHITD